MAPAEAALSRVFDTRDPSHHFREQFSAVMYLAEAAVRSGQHDDARAIVARMEVTAQCSGSRLLLTQLRYAAAVDAGLIMHYFGSKQELFRRVIDAAPVPGVSGAPEQAAEQILATLASRLASEPAASLALLRSMLTNPEAASVAIARYQAQIAQAIPADDASLRAAIISAIILGVTVSRHLIKSDDLASADPEQVISLLRPCMLALAAQPFPSTL